MPASVTYNGATFNPPPNTAIVSAWNSITVGNYILPYQASTQSYITGKEITILPGNYQAATSYYDIFGNLIIVPEVAPSELRIGTTLEIGQPVVCNNVPFPVNDELVKNFCFSQTGYRAGRNFPNLQVRKEPVEEQSTESARTTRLLSAYPNPTSSSVRIGYEIGERGLVQLFLQNARGEVLAVLAQDEQHGEGGFEVTFDASPLPAGIYYYTLQTAHGRETKRLVVAK